MFDSWYLFIQIHLTSKMSSKAFNSLYWDNNQDEMSTHYSRYALLWTNEKNRKWNVSVRYTEVRCPLTTSYPWPRGSLDE